MFNQLIECLYKDQGSGKRGKKWFFLRAISNANYSVLYTFRIGTFLKSHKYLLIIPYAIICLWHRWNCYKTGVQLGFGTKIGAGMTIAHYGNIIINDSAEIGQNCLIFQGVTIGSKRGPKGGTPTIGNNVVLFSGCKILGGVKLGNNVVVGANAVVLKDVPDNAVVVGVPAKIVSYNANDTIKYYLTVES